MLRRASKYQQESWVDVGSTRKFGGVRSVPGVLAHLWVRLVDAALAIKGAKWGWGGGDCKLGGYDPL